MVDLDEAAAMIKSFSRVKEGRRGHIRTFRMGGRVFATLNEKENRSCLRLNEVDQDVFSRLRSEDIFPVPNKNGAYGWTLFMMGRLPKRLYKDAVGCALAHMESMNAKRRLKNL